VSACVLHACFEGGCIASVHGVLLVCMASVHWHLPVFFPGSETKFDQDTADTTGLSMQLSEQLLQQSVSISRRLKQREPQHGL
jgi:hypothetical protein